MSSDQVICLSDSDEETPTNEESNVNDDYEADFEFPAVQFHYRVDKPKNIINNVEKRNIIDFDNTDNASPLPVTAESDANARIFSNDQLPRNSNEFIPTVDQKTNNKSHEAASRRKATGRGQGKDVDSRMKEKEEIARDKRIKALERQNRKNIQPGECMKFMQVSIDREIENFPFYTDILRQLKDSDIHCRLESLPITNSITWTRKVDTHYINGSNEICTKSENQMANQMIVIWNWDEAVKKIKDGSFLSSIENITSMCTMEQQQITLILYGTDEYFGNCKKLKKQTNGRKNQGGGDFEKVPKISRHELEVSLAEVQLMLKCNSRLIETAQELASLVYQFTKAIAEIPLKLEKMQKTAEKIDWYATGDNRDTVRVDKNGNGLKRLWQQQLCQFNLATLETAEAISSVYPSPRDLMQAYATRTREEGETLLRDISIRRAAGPLSTVRKIGLELSKKVFIMFTSMNGEITLGNDPEL